MKIRNISFTGYQVPLHSKKYEIHRKDGTVISEASADKIVKRNMMLTNAVIMPLTFSLVASIFFHSKKALKSIAGMAIIMSATIGYYTIDLLKTDSHIIKTQNPQSLYKWGGFKVVNK